MKTCITYHEKFSEYDLGANHPFRGDRFIKAKKFFEGKRLFESPDIFLIKPKAVERSDLLKVHTEEYVNHIFRLAKICKPYDLDTPLSPPILDALTHMIGGVIEAGEAVLEGHANRAFALGGGFHHAGRNYGGGFCIFNDIALLVEHLRERYRLKRVLILDYDVHAGNGTSDIYYSDPGVLYISIHQDPQTIFPGKGFVNEIGEDAGEGYNINIPLPMRTGEQVYLHALSEIVNPLVDEFKPEVIIGNGGSDAHFSDHLGSLGLTAKGFFEISRFTGEAADRVSSGRIILLVTSGYNILVLPYSWYALVAGLAGICKTKDEIEDYYPPPSDPWQNKLKVENTLKDLKKILHEYWRCF